MTLTVGFTGTRRALTRDEQFRIAGLIHHLPEGTRIVTGACIGLDAFVAAFARREGRPVHTIVPADRSRVDPHWRDHCTTYELMSKGTTFRNRNVKIVGELVGPDDYLIAVPDHVEQAPESLRSGTWQTIRLARKSGKPVEVHVLCADCDPRRPQQPGGGETDGA